MSVEAPSEPCFPIASEKEPLPSPSPSPIAEASPSPAEEDEALQRKRKMRPIVGPQRRVQEKMPIEMVGRPAAAASDEVIEEGYMGQAVADQVLKVGKTFTRARRLIDWFKDRVENGTAVVRGREVTAEDVEAAELRVKEVWKLRLARKQRPTIGNVELVMQRTAQRCDDADSAKEFISKIDVGKVSRKGRVFSKIDLAEAEGKCQQLFERIPETELSKDLSSAGVEAQRKADGEVGYISDLSSDSGEDSDSEKENVSNDDGEPGYKGQLRQQAQENEKKDSEKAGADGEKKAEGDHDGEDEESEEEDLSDEEEVDVEAEGLLPPDELEAAPKRDLAKPKIGTGAWAGAPAVGAAGFNDFAVATMRKAKVASSPLLAKLDKSIPCPPLQPHQEAAVFLLKPESPISRLLVDHPTGSGKTREMIDVLNSYFHDPRPKVPVFPKEAVCRNFYAELLRWPSLYRDYFSCLRPGSVACCAGVRDWRIRRSHLWELNRFSEKDMKELTRDIREVLEMKKCFYMGRMHTKWRTGFHKKFPNEQLPAAPLRALRYTSAGGRHTFMDKEGLPASALFKIGFDRADGNVYSSKVVVMDEVHNMVRSNNTTKFGEQLACLRELLFNAHDIVLAGFTGTPILSEPSEGRQLLDIIKGRGAPSGDDGFISSFHVRPQPLFPSHFPQSIPDKVITAKIRKQFVRKVELLGEPLQRYEQKRSDGASIRCLRRYCSLCVHFGSFHDGKSGTKARILRGFAACAPKLHAIAADVAAETSKCVVFVERHSGLIPLLEYLRRVASSCDPPFGVATMDEVADFNSPDNLHGERYRVLVADALQVSEGVSFFAVRRALFADVPASPGALVQTVGRTIRMYGHAGLPLEEQTVSSTLYAAALPRWLRSTLGAWCYRIQKKVHWTDKQKKAKLQDEMQGHTFIHNEKRAKSFLRALKQVRISSLEGLKTKLDQFCNARRALSSDKQPLSAEDAARFFESVGLWKYAVSIRSAEVNKVTRHQKKPKTRKIPEQRMERALKKSNSNAPLPEEPEKEEKQDPEAQPDAAEKTATTPTSASTPLAKSLRRTLSRNISEVSIRPASALGRALFSLRAFGSAQEAEETFHLSTLTADEQSLHSLSTASREFVPALVELRSKAMDREILEPLMGTVENGNEDSEGEASDYGFAVSDGSDNDEDAKAVREAPLVLPPGWRAVRMQINNKNVTQFFDPRGARYKTESQAQAAVANQRIAANMSRNLMAKFADKFKAAAAAKAATEDAAMNTAQESDGDLHAHQDKKLRTA